MNDNVNFNRILEGRSVTPSLSNLSERIIAAAAVQNNTPLWIIIMQELSAMFILPRPAYAMAFTLILGVVLGLQAETEQLSSAQDWLSFMSVDNDYLIESWL